MKVHWTVRAEARLDAICDHVGADSQTAAKSLERRLLLRSRQSATFPHSGRIVPEYDSPDVRELIEGNYRVIYRVFGDRVDVLTVMHCAQLLPSDCKKLSSASTGPGVRFESELQAVRSRSATIATNTANRTTIIDVASLRMWAFSCAQHPKPAPRPV